MSTTSDLRNNIATKVIDDLLDAAEAVMVDRRYQILNNEPDEAYLADTMQVHDYLLSVAKEMTEVFDTARESEDDEEFEGEQSTPLIDRIFDGMARLGYDVDDLADNAQVGKDTLARILTGETQRPQARTLRKIEKALGHEEGALDV